MYLLPALIMPTLLLLAVLVLGLFALVIARRAYA